MTDHRPNGSDDLDRRIAAAKVASGVAEVKPVEAKGYGQGARVLTELIGAPLGAGVIGFALDHWFNTSPWCLMILLVLGVVVAFRNIYRISKERPE